MFWGLNLKANRKYSQTTSKSFHISQAALDIDSGAGPARLFLTYENEKFLVCTLRKGECEQVMLDYNFAEGDEISFESKGTGNVALTGYICVDPMESYMDGDEEDSEEEVDEVIEASDLKDLRAALNKKKAKKGAVVKANDKEDEDDDDDEEDDEEIDNEQVEAESAEDEEQDEDDDEEEDEDDEEEDDDDEEDEDDDEENEPVEQPKQKKAKLDNQAIKQNGVAKGAEKEKKKKNKEHQADGNKQQGKQTAGERVVTGGVKIQDIRVGNGPEVKQGKRAQVYYEGRLKSNNKVFDSSKQGAGFKFSVGRGEVIKGWDVGVVGMKVGGKRRITCPPHMAYGARGAPPSIPPNSTLVFEVELKGVN